VRKHDDEMELALAQTAMSDRRELATNGVPTDERTSDSQLLGMIAHGDRAAFDALYHRYARTVFGLALRRLGDRDRAEEAVQETFTAVWRSARSYRADRGPGAPWLYAVARNAIVDRFRGRGEPVAEVPEAASPDAGPAEAAEAEWVAWRVHRALEELPSTERQVLELAYWSGLSQSEVASFLDIPLGTVKTRTRSALSRLSGVLEGEDLS
jgi:RNA polymerase sigma-70 factor (ECF subfamily)